ncbi:hypothetical protein G7046_g5745 [Stylonectria norvegica]|nr:hypothetical protein G7046_g5745 [Stylonectria norvegica]
MAPGSPSGKRKAPNAPISPPPLKRKIQSENAVANFFTPTSQKPKDRTTWSERSPHDDTAATLLVARYEPEVKETQILERRKIAAFDLDSTLITTSSGKKHGNTASDWKWWHNQVPGRLRELYQDEGYRVVILSNQAGLTLHFDAKYKGPKANANKRVSDFKQKCSAVLSSLDLPTSVFAATERDIYRKPRTGMWKELCEDYDIREEDVDLENSIFVGDAGGRIANFAHNVGIKYQTPEEFFLGEKPRDFVRDMDLVDYPLCKQDQQAPDMTDKIFERRNDKDIVLFCGPPGAGKSTFYWKYLKPLGYERINQDTLKSRDKCVQVAKEHLDQGNSITVDNTNAGQDTRAMWIELAKEYSIPIRCVWFRTPLQLCEHNDAVRSLNQVMNPESRQGLPKVAFTSFATRYKTPHVNEGFQDLVEVPFKFRGTMEEYGIWGRYWV